MKFLRNVMCVIDGCWRPFSRPIVGIAGICLTRMKRVMRINGDVIARYILAEN
jgi:hypothetical protein